MIISFFFILILFEYLHLLPVNTWLPIGIFVLFTLSICCRESRLPQQSIISRTRQTQPPREYSHTTFAIDKNYLRLAPVWSRRCLTSCRCQHRTISRVYVNEFFCDIWWTPCACAQLNEESVMKCRVFCRFNNVTRLSAKFDCFGALAVTELVDIQLIQMRICHSDSH